MKEVSYSHPAGRLDTDIPLPSEAASPTLSSALLLPDPPALPTLPPDHLEIPDLVNSHNWYYYFDKEGLQDTDLIHFKYAKYSPFTNQAQETTQYPLLTPQYDPLVDSLVGFYEELQNYFGEYESAYGNDRLVSLGYFMVKFIEFELLYLRQYLSHCGYFCQVYQLKDLKSQRQFIELRLLAVLLK